MCQCLYFSRQSQAVERAVQDLVDLLKSQLKEKEKANLSGHYPCLHPDSKNKRCLECIPCCFSTMLTSFNQKNTDALIKCKQSRLVSYQHFFNWDRYLWQPSEGCLFVERMFVEIQQVLHCALYFCLQVFKFVQHRFYVYMLVIQTVGSYW